MSENKGIVRTPSISDISFNCPHCGALAKQFWYKVRAVSMKDDCNPKWLTEDQAKEYVAKTEKSEEKEKFLAWAKVQISRRPFPNSGKNSYYCSEVQNVHFAKCYNCEEMSIWFGEGIVWPARGAVARPNSDIPADALTDYEEAAQIVDSSPRGAAALLRLCIQKICIFLGGEGKNINADISQLVTSGLDMRVQKALDVVRVIGNNAVHPGEMDIKDDRETANNLFNLVNLIVDIMISQPKHVSDMFSNLPAGALDAIAKRDSTK